MANYYLTDQAIADLEAIAEYGVNHWGIRARDAFIDDFFNLFTDIAINTTIGTPRNDIKKGYRCRYLNPYVTFYIQLESGELAIIGILHQAQDIENALKN